MRVMSGGGKGLHFPCNHSIYLINTGDFTRPMNPTIGPKLKYGSSAHNRLTVELDHESVVALLTIQETLRLESASPTVPVSRSVAVRRSIKVYAASLARNLGRLREETENASQNTYIHKRR